MDIDIHITSNRKLVEAEVNAAIDAGLEACGLKAEGIAKKLAQVDTGLMKNSITHAVSGYSFSHNYTDDNGQQSGSVSGVIGTKEDHACYIGTNVEYAPYVEYGTSRTAQHPFLRPTAENYSDVYEAILKKVLSRLS